ncbi:hypothetical protein TELCIR_07679 [Teladorsagia circumcincta]|uniref:Uncharacterized protein n=1 Tax=Teladorsagia circumcincta TaxID=45464 RepID=A0A2G9UJP2_TELCI|nr:hypothetical protein TELCIR_07679 [Teladorsagia circumcincta]
MQSTSDPRRPNKIVRFKAADPQSSSAVTDDPLPEYMNVLGMIFSKSARCSPLPIPEDPIRLFKAADPQSSSAVTDDPLPEYMNVLGMIFNSVVILRTVEYRGELKLGALAGDGLSVSAVVMSYLQNPQPIIPPWASFM